MQHLISSGVDVNQKDENSITPLIYAAKYGHIGSINLLLENGADPLNETDICMAFVAAAYGGHVDCLERIMKLDVDINQSIQVKEDNETVEITVLAAACQNGHNKCVELLLRKGANIDEATLPQLAVNGQADILKLLLDVYGSPVDETDNIRLKPLINAAIHNQMSCMKVLLER